MIISFVKDLFFVSKIKETSEQLNKENIFIKDYKDLRDFFNNVKINKSINDNNDLIIIDLNFKEIKPFELIKNLKENNELKNIKILSYCSHVDIDLISKAKEFGIEVIPRSLFAKKLAEIINI